MSDFDVLNKKLDLLLVAINALNVTKPVVNTPAVLFEKIPVQEIFRKKILSKPSFYAHVKSGKITLYKLGGRSYVDAKEFDAVFRKVVVYQE